MPVIQLSSSIPANGSVENTVAGSQFEFLPYNALLEFAINGSAAGLVFDVYTGQDALCETAFAPGVNRFGIYPDDFNLQDVAAAGERIKVRVRNTTGTALTQFTTVRITPA